jgi:hypothetical protein
MRTCSSTWSLRASICSSWVIELVHRLGQYAPADCCTHRLGQFHDLHVGLVSQVVYLCPEKGDTASDLNETVPFLPFNAAIPTHLEASARIHHSWVGQDQLLRLVIVCDVARRIDTTGEVTCPRSVTRTSRNQAEENVVRIDGGRSQFDGWINEKLVYWSNRHTRVAPPATTHIQTASEG